MDEQGQVIISTELELVLDCIIDVLDILVVFRGYEYVVLEHDVIGE